MKYWFIFTWLLLSFLVYAQDTSIIPQTQGDVTFVSGGVGGDQRDALQAMRADYNLSLIFSARGSGEYLSQVKVSILDSAGNTVLATVAEGPMLLVKLKPGSYAVSADNDGQVVEKKVTVKDKRGITLSFTWPR